MANANLLARFAQPVRSVQDYQDDYMRRDVAQQGLQRNALLLQEGQAVQQDRERSRAEGETLRNALMAAGPNASLAQRAAAARATGLQSGYKFADDWEKSDADIGAKRATTGKTVQETQAGAFQLTADKDAQARKLLQVATNPEHATQMIDAAVAKGFWTPEDADLVKRGISRDVAQFEQSKLRQLGPALAAKDMMPRQGVNNSGGFDSFYSQNPLDGTVTVNSRTARQQSPDSAASERTAAAGRAQSAQQFNTRLGYDREKDAAARADGTKIVPSQQKVADATEVLSLLDTAESLLPGATSSYAGTAIDEAARVVGLGTSGAQSGARLKALEGALISKMPKMSGPQSDKDVLLYKQMAGQIGDSTMPASTRKAAIETIREMNRRYAGLPAESAPGAPATGYSDAEKERRYQDFKRSQGK